MMIRFCSISGLLILTAVTSLGDPLKIAPVYLFIDKEQKYLSGGTMERVAFQSNHGNETNSLMVRYGLLYKHPRARATILVCHGFMCDKFDIGFLRMALFDGYNVMTFDFRAHGEGVDQRQCCTFGRDEAYDVLAAATYLKSRPDVNHLPLIAYGFSMGAVAAIQAQAGYGGDTKLFDAMILDCPYDSSENVIKQSLSNLRITLFGYSFSVPGTSLLQKYAFNPYVQMFIKGLLKTIAHMDATATNTYIYPVAPSESIKQVAIPCFFIHCYHDEKVSVAAARTVYANKQQGYKRLWITQGRRHFDSFLFYPEKYRYKVQRFIERVVTDDLGEQQAKIIYDITV